MMYFHTTHQSGFSLVETLVAITILLIVITGPLTLVSNSARSTDFANDQVMAFFLAQEGLELIQAERDNYLIPVFVPAYSGPNAWDAFLSDADLQSCFTTVNVAGCGVDVSTDLVGSLNVYNCASDPSGCRLYFNAAAGQRATYTHVVSAGNETRYNRTITMTRDGTSQVEVVSTVTWRSDGQRAVNQVQTKTYLFDVYGR